MIVELRADQLRETSNPVVAAVGESTFGVYRETLRQVQVLLEEGGRYKSKIDGLCSPNIQRALESYQKQVGLTLTSLPDQATLFKPLSPSAALN
jgi:peptidoglycan hydrolase-like protein with peptidoglycan-binding domain